MKPSGSNQQYNSSYPYGGESIYLSDLKGNNKLIDENRITMSGDISGKQLIDKLSSLQMKANIIDKYINAQSQGIPVTFDHVQLGLTYLGILRQ